MLAGMRSCDVLLEEGNHAGNIRLPSCGEDDAQPCFGGYVPAYAFAALGDAKDVLDSFERPFACKPFDRSLQFGGVHRAIAPVDGTQQLAAPASDDGHDG